MEDRLQLRKNSIGITYNEGEIRRWHFGQIIGGILGIPEEQVEGIDTCGNCRFLFEVSTAECYNYICETFSGRDIPIGNNCVI